MRLLSICRVSSKLPVITSSLFMRLLSIDRVSCILLVRRLSILAHSTARRLFACFGPGFLRWKPCFRFRFGVAEYAGRVRECFPKSPRECFLRGVSRRWPVLLLVYGTCPGEIKV